MAASIPSLQSSLNFFIMYFYNASKPVQCYEHEANRNKIPELGLLCLHFPLRNFARGTCDMIFLPLLSMTHNKKRSLQYLELCGLPWNSRNYPSTDNIPVYSFTGHPNPWHCFCRVGVWIQTTIKLYTCCDRRGCGGRTFITHPFASHARLSVRHLRGWRTGSSPRWRNFLHKFGSIAATLTNVHSIHVFPSVQGHN